MVFPLGAVMPHIVRTDNTMVQSTRIKRDFQQLLEPLTEYRYSTCCDKTLLAPALMQEPSCVLRDVSDITCAHTAAGTHLFAK